MRGVAFVAAVAVGVGVAVTLQAQLLGVMEQRVGPIAAASLTFVVGGLAGMVVLAVARPDLSRWQQVPWWAWPAGIAGIALVAGLSYAMPRLGVTNTLSIVIAAQLAAAVLLERTGWLESVIRPFEPGRVLGLALVMVGAWLVVR